MTRRTFVLVHGAWVAGWAWHDVTQRLQALGHYVSAPTLTGLGERAHHLRDDIGLSTHIDDVVAHIEMEDLVGVSLVGWSYGGLVVSGVLARVPQRISSVCYFDAFVPRNGESLADLSRGVTAATAREHKAARTPFPPRRPEQFGVTDEAVIAYCLPRLRPQPWKAMVEPVVALPEPPAHVALSYVLCTKPETKAFRHAYERVRVDQRWTTHELAADHFAPLTDPDGTVRVITA